MRSLVGLVAVLGLVALACASPAATPAPNVAEGKALFVGKGCGACHGAEAQGGIGPNLKQPQQTADAITTAVRSGKGSMSAFPASQLSDAELQNIIAFLRAP